MGTTSLLFDGLTDVREIRGGTWDPDFELVVASTCSSFPTASSVPLFHCVIGAGGGAQRSTVISSCPIVADPGGAAGDFAGGADYDRAVGWGGGLAVAKICSSN